jgi:hypothetical protein
MWRSRITIILILFFGVLFSFPVEGQGFGSDPSNYYCPEVSGGTLVSGSPEEWVGKSVYQCTYSVSSDGAQRFETRNAIPRPPQLRVLQVWFIRIVYVIWAVTGVVFMFLLMWIGFKYITSVGNEVALADVIKDFRKWMIGLALIFLSYPMLNTFFRILPVSQDQCFSEVNAPGFQFFFPEACVTSEDICREQLGGNLTDANLQNCLDGLDSPGGL